MSIAEIATVVIAVLALISGGFATIAWFYKRGRDEQKLTNSVDRLNETGKLQASATNELAGQVSGLRTTLEQHSETLIGHHYRIKALEERSPVRVTVDAP